MFFIKVNKEDLVEILKDVNDRAKTSGAFRRLDTATRRPKIQIFCKRWLQTSAGNTYHSVSIFIDDIRVAFIPETYGYGEQCLQTAVDWLGTNGYIKGKKQYGTLFLRETLGASYTITDVNTKREMMQK